MYVLIIFLNLHCSLKCSYLVYGIIYRFLKIFCDVQAFFPFCIQYDMVYSAYAIIVIFFLLHRVEKSSIKCGSFIVRSRYVMYVGILSSLSSLYSGY